MWKGLTVAPPFPTSFAELDSRKEGSFIDHQSLSIIQTKVTDVSRTWTLQCGKTWKVHLPFLRFNRSRSNDRTKDSGKTKDFQLHAPVSPSQICSFVPVTLFVTIYGLSPNRLGMAASNEIKRLPEEISICYLSLLPRPVMSFCDGSLCFSIHT